MSDLVEWLTKILDEDERAAKRAGGSITHMQNDNYGLLLVPHGWVLDDVAAKRAIIARHAAVRLSGDTRCAVCIKPEWPCATLHDMATAYADRAGYDKSRRP